MRSTLRLSLCLGLGTVLAASVANVAVAQTAPGLNAGASSAPDKAGTTATPTPATDTQTPAGPETAAPSQTPSPQPSQPSAAQSPAAPPASAALEPFRPADPAKARYNVQVMEGVLERAVRYAASQMNRRLQAVSPDLLQLSGAARARGFRLPGYGVFFDVDVPAALRHTMGWTLRLMQQSDQNVQRALSALRQSLGDLDPKQRAQAEGYLKLLETRFQPPPNRPRMVIGPQGQSPDPSNAEPAAEAVRATSASSPNLTLVNNAPQPVNPSTPAPSANDPAAATPPPASPTPTADDLAWAQNPDLAYEMEVRDALVGAMLEYGSTLTLAPDEYLTVAARDSENIVMPGDLSETVTVLLRIKGSDLSEFKSGRLTEAEARRRIEVREF